MRNATLDKKVASILESLAQYMTEHPDAGSATNILMAWIGQEINPKVGRKRAKPAQDHGLLWPYLHPGAATLDQRNKHWLNNIRGQQLGMAADRIGVKPGSTIEESLNGYTSEDEIRRDVTDHEVLRSNYPELSDKTIASLKKKLRRLRSRVKYPKSFGG